PTSGDTSRRIHPGADIRRRHPGAYGSTSSVNFISACGPPVLFAVTLMLDTATFAFGLTVKVNVEFAGLPGETVIAIGSKLAVTPAGKPPTLRLTLPTNPVTTLTVMVLVPEGV